jgi:hypothetical protein
LLTATVATVGCPSGLKFINSAANLPVPPALQERTLWTDTAIVQYKLEALSGYILERPNPNSPWKRKRQILPSGFVPKIEPITDGEFYHSIVDNKIAGTGSVKIPILSVAASLAENQRMELTITDAALIFIPDKDIPYAEFNSYAQTNPLPAGATRVWVQAVMLTKLLFSQANETNSSATVSGSAFQVDGKVYNSNSLLQRQPYITMFLVDVAEAEKHIAAAGGIDSFVQSMSAVRSITGSPLRYTKVETQGIER